MHTCVELKAMGMHPIGYDNISPYYSVALKELRISVLKNNMIPFVEGDVCDESTLKETIQKYNITRVIHLAAQGKLSSSPIITGNMYVDCREE
jgi:UDP-glucuronate 4-epimerase